MPGYVGRIQKALAGAAPPDCVVELRRSLSRIGSGDIRDLGMQIKGPFEQACRRGWFNDRDASGIEQLLQFCSAVPLVGFK
jgi:hypothetical protein